jgi:hypothetical protein
MSTKIFPLMSGVSRQFKKVGESTETVTLCVDIKCVTCSYNRPAVSNFECHNIIYFTGK